MNLSDNFLRGLGVVVFGLGVLAVDAGLGLCLRDDRAVARVDLTAGGCVCVCPEPSGQAFDGGAP